MLPYDDNVLLAVASHPKVDLRLTLDVNPVAPFLNPKEISCISTY